MSKLVPPNGGGELGPLLLKGDDLKESQLLSPPQMSRPKVLARTEAGAYEIQELLKNADETEVIWR